MLPWALYYNRLRSVVPRTVSYGGVLSWGGFALRMLTCVGAWTPGVPANLQRFALVLTHIALSVRELLFGGFPHKGCHTNGVTGNFSASCCNMRP